MNQAPSEPPAPEEKHLELTPEELAARTINAKLKHEARPYPEQFGKMIEQATAEFLVEHFKNIVSVRHSNALDDAGAPFHQPGFDLIVEWVGGEKIAVDVTVDDDPERVREKTRTRANLDPSVDYAKKRPVVDAHDEMGRVVTAKIPFAVLLYSYDSVKEWEKAVDAWKASGRKESIANWVEKQNDLKIDIIVSLAAAVKSAIDKFPYYRRELALIELVLDRELAELREEMKFYPASHRRAHRMIRHDDFEAEAERHALS